MADTVLQQYSNLSTTCAEFVIVPGLESRALGQFFAEWRELLNRRERCLQTPSNLTERHHPNLAKPRQLPKLESKKYNLAV